MKKLTLKILFILVFSVNANANNHHSFLLCENAVELEIDLKKNKVFLNGRVFEIGEKDELYIYAKKK